MKETQIRKKALNTLKAAGWRTWYPYRVRYRKEKDIFGVYDIVAVKGKKTRFIQLTTKSHVGTRKKKVKKFLKSNNLSIQSEVWGYNKKTKKFDVHKVNK